MNGKLVSLIFLFLQLTAFPAAFPKGKTKLLFGEDGTFKIAQFTDIHYKPGDSLSEPSVELVRYIIATEKPRLVVFTGDIVVGTPAAEGWDAILKPVVENRLPFAVTLGNHDDEHDLTRRQIYELLEKYPGYTGKKPFASSGFGDYVVKVEDAERGNAANLYFLDSNAYSTLEGVEGYGWFLPEQVNWYSRQSHKNAGAGRDKIPALAFFHIPLPEYRMAFNSEAPRTGQRNEDECSPGINTGMFAAMLMAGDVMGTFVGHDHVNDYLVNHYGIALAYGRWSGGKTTYGDLQHGSRIIQLESGKRGFQTWIRLRDGKKIDEVTFPAGLK